jgi:hypothetical protein
MALSIIFYKMSDNFFDLVCFIREAEHHYFFEGPDKATGKDFEDLCSSLVPKAGYKAALKRSDPDNGGWIIWPDVVEALVFLLEEQGYQRIYFDTFYCPADINGDPTIRIYDRDTSGEELGFSAKMIIEHNRRIDDERAKKREALWANNKALFKKTSIQIIK